MTQTESGRLLAHAESMQGGERAPYLAIADSATTRPPGRDARGTGRLILTVVDTVTGLPVHRIMQPWDVGSASLGHRLIEHGFMVLPAAHYRPELVAGWLHLPDGTRTAPCMSRDGIDAPPGACAVDGCITWIPDPRPCCAEGSSCDS